MPLSIPHPIPPQTVTLSPSYPPPRWSSWASRCRRARSSSRLRGAPYRSRCSIRRACWRGRWVQGGHAGGTGCFDSPSSPAPWPIPLVRENRGRASTPGSRPCERGHRSLPLPSGPTTHALAVAPLVVMHRHSVSPATWTVHAARCPAWPPPSSSSGCSCRALCRRTRRGSRPRSWGRRWGGPGRRGRRRRGRRRPRATG